MASITEVLKTDIVLREDMERTPAGDLALIAGLANLKLALFHRLITVPGAYVRRPNYGVGLPLYQNAPSSFAIQQRLVAKIEEQFKLDARVEDVVSIAIDWSDTQPEMTFIRVFVKPVGYSEIEMIFHPFAGGKDQ